MSVQWYALLVVLVGLALWLRGSVLGAIIATLFFTLFGGGAAFLIGGSSIQPASFFLVFLLSQVLLSMFRRSSHVQIGLRTNVYLVFYCIYAAATALILPKIFARTMELPPMSAVKGDIYATVLLSYSKENIIAGIYLIGTLITSICAGAATADPRSRYNVVTWAVIISWIHIGFGLLGLLFGGPGSHIISFFRNAKYAQLTQDTFGFVRMDGIFPEPSAYGGYAFIWLVFMVELWLRQVRPRITGPTTLALLVVVLLCTSTSTYFGVAVYAAIMLVRWLLAPGGLRTSKVVLVGMGTLTAVALVLAVLAFLPSAASVAGRILESMTLNKLHSTSGMGRAFWAKAGLHAFIKSYGLGVGAGSFRCSSLLLAMMGSTGVIGTLAFGGHILKIMRPLRASTYEFADASKDPIGVSAAWAACAGLLPGLVSSPTADPSLVFAVLGGLALGWRYQVEREKSPATVARAWRAPQAAEPVPA